MPILVPSGRHDLICLYLGKLKNHYVLILRYWFVNSVLVAGLKCKTGSHIGWEGGDPRKKQITPDE